MNEGRSKWHIHPNFVGYFKLPNGIEIYLWFFVFVQTWASIHAYVIQKLHWIPITLSLLWVHDGCGFDSLKQLILKALIINGNLTQETLARCLMSFGASWMNFSKGYEIRSLCSCRKKYPIFSGCPLCANLAIQSSQWC